MPLPRNACSVDGCPAPHEARGYCNKHYLRWRKTGDPLAGARLLVNMGECRVEECGRKSLARGLCRPHYRQSLKPPECSVDGCQKTALARGFCSSHLRRFHKYGSTVSPEKKPKAQRICSVESCEKLAGGSGLCRSHHMRKLRHGDPQAGTAENGAPLAFVMDALSYNGDECLIWPFSNRRGYASVYVEGKVETASRFVCERVHGPPPFAAADAAHSCGNGHVGCIAPGHLRWATRLENAGDTITHGRTTRGVKNAMAKLTDSDVLEIRALRGRMSEREVGERFNISAAHAGAIMRRRAWRWLPDD